MFTPRLSSTSAAPDLLEALLLPCFATGMPAAAITNEEVVEILNVPELSPPVPTISRTSKGAFIFAALFRITSAQAVISSMFSPFILSEVRKAEIWEGVALPFIISVITSFASS